MIRPEDGLLTMEEAAAHVKETWRRPCIASTVRRWAKTGLRGVVLEITGAGATPVTTRAAIERFFGDYTRARMPYLDSRPERRGMSRDEAESILR